VDFTGARDQRRVRPAFDNLDDRTAAALIAALFGWLAPGGRLLVANFTAEVPERGYMEALMDGWLVYRTPSQMASLAVAIDGAIDVARDQSGRVTYLSIVRR
jgi:hypothetical protein